jgi:hypothetical protein
MHSITNEFWELGFEWVRMHRTVQGLEDLDSPWRKCRCTLAQQGMWRYLFGIGIIPGIFEQDTDESMPWILDKLLEPLTTIQSYDHVVVGRREYRMNYLDHNPDPGKF